MCLMIDPRSTEEKSALTGKGVNSCFEGIAVALTGLYSCRRVLSFWVVAGLTFLLVINSSWKATPDSALYLELGRSLALGSGYLFNGEPHTYVPPGYPFMVASVAGIFGDGFLAYRILMAAMGLLTAGLGYALVYRLAGPDTGLVVGGLVAVNHALVFNSTFTTSDVPFALVAMVALHVLLCAADTNRRVTWVVAAGLLAGLPALIRINGWGIPPAGTLFLFCAWRGRSAVERVLLTAVFVAVSLIPGLVWEGFKASFPVSSNEGTYLNAVTGRTGRMQGAIILASAWEYVYETSYALTAVSLRSGALELLVPFLVLAGMVTVFARGERLLVPLTVIQYCGLFLSPAGSRYLILLVPGLYLFLAEGIVRVWEWISAAAGRDHLSTRGPRMVLLGFFGVLALSNIGHNVFTILQARTALESEGAESARDLPFFLAARWLKSNAGGAVVLTMHPRVIRYLSGLPTAELVRSGVPESRVWVDAHDEIRQLVQDRKPTFVFSDEKSDRMFSQVRQAIESLDLRLEEVSEASSPPRFRLWKIRRAP